MSEVYKYFAFISYNSKDVEWGKRLQRKLEGYKMPATLCSEHGWERTPIKPVFFAPTDIQPDDLNEEIKSRLRASRNLIVICSPRSAQSEWVGKEIAYFHSLGRGANIRFFIIEGVPNSGDPATECYNEVVRKLGMQGVLGVNINERNFRWRYLNRERAYVQLITKLLGIEFDDIWQRHKRLMAEKIATLSVAMVATVTIIIWALVANMPVDVKVRLEEATPKNVNVPQLSDAELTLTVGDYERTERITSVDGGATFISVPRSLLGQSAKLKFVDFPDTPDAMNYYPREVELKLEKSMTLEIRRDTIKYGRLRAKFIDSNYRPIPHHTTTIAGERYSADADGFIDVQIPFSRQARSYVVEGDTLTDVGLCSIIAITVE